MTISQVLQRLYLLDKHSSEFLRALYAFIRVDENGEYSSGLQESESARLVNFMDEALDVIPVTDPLFRRCLRRLRHICGHYNILPSSHIISTGLKTTSEYVIAYGGFADVWEGMLAGEKVCVKMLRIHPAHEGEHKNTLAPFYREAVVWKRLRHPNVVPFLGVTTTQLWLVSKWMPNGTLTDYVNAKPHVDRIGLLLDVAEGLNYLHTCHMVHGDLKGPNILIDGSENARVCDFGLASIAYGKHTPRGPRSDKGHTPRWSAPEILSGECTTSKQADIFALGMVVVEAFTGNVPFYPMISSAVTWKIMNGQLPSRPYDARELGLTDSVWNMTESCWLQHPNDRLKASEMVDLLREMYAVSSHNSLVDVISCTPRSAESDPTIQQTEAALSPKLLKILQYRESTQKSAPVFRTPGQRAIMQRLKAVGEVLQGSSLSSPSSSNTVSTTGNDSWHTADPGVTIPQILVQEDEPTLSNGSGSSFTAVDISECQRATSAGSETNHMVSMMNSPRALDSRSNRRDNDTKEVRNTTKPETQQRGPLGQKPGRPLPRGRAHYRSLLAFPPMGADLDTTTQAMKSLEIEPTPSRQSSSKRKGVVEGLLAVFGLGDHRQSSRSATPTSERENSKSRECGGEYRPSDAPPKQTNAPRKGLNGWGRVRVMTKGLVIQKRHHP